MDRTKEELALLARLTKEQKRLVVEAGGPCEWGMCFHCALRGLGRRALDLKAILGQLEAAQPPVEEIDLYTAGSIWKPGLEEMLPEIWARVNAMPWIKRVVVESRPELVTTERIDRLSEALATKEIRLGVGLDHKDNTIRNCMLNRGESLSEYSAAMDISKRRNLKRATFVAVGAPLLTDRQALESAYETALYASECGSEIVSLEPIQIQLGTIQDTVHKAGFWDVPWLWTVTEAAVKILNGLIRRTQVIIGGDVQAPLPTGGPNNRCTVCDNDGRFQTAFRRFNETQNLWHLINLNCKCKAAWLKIMRR